MKTILSLLVCLLVAGCTNVNATKKEKLLRKALADTNVALTEAQQRALQYQKAYERLVREKIAQRRHASKKSK